MKKSIIAIAILSIFAGSAQAAEPTDPAAEADAGVRHEAYLQKMQEAQAEFESMSREMVNFQWVGGSIGMANKSVQTPLAAGVAGIGFAPPAVVTGLGNLQTSNSIMQPNFNLNFTKGVIFTGYKGSKVPNFGVAGEANLLSMNSRLIPLFKLDAVVVLPGESLIFLPNLGYSVRTGGTVGLDAIHPICNQNDCSVSLKFGITKFNKNVEGANFVANIGIVKAF